MDRPLQPQGNMLYETHAEHYPASMHHDMVHAQDPHDVMYPHADVTPASSAAVHSCADPAATDRAVGHFAEPAMPPMPTDQAASWVQSTLKKDGLNAGATTMFAALLDVDPAQRQTLVAQLGQTLGTMGTLIAAGPKGVGPALDEFAKSATLLDPKTAMQLASSVATAMSGPATFNAAHPTMEAEIGGLVKGEVAAGEGPQFGIALAHAFAAQGATDLASSVATNVVDGVKRLQANYGTATAARDGALADLYGQTGPGMAALTGPQQAAVLAAYENHSGCQGTFDACSQSGEQLAEALAVLPRLGKLADTSGVTATLASIADNPGAQKYFADELAKQAKSQPSTAGEVVEQLRTLQSDESLASNVANLVVKSTGLAAIDLLQRGDTATVATLFKGLEGSHDLLGVSEKDMTSLTDAFTSGSPAKIEAAFRQAQTSPGFSSAVGANVLKGLGVALGAYSAIEGGGNDAMTDPATAMHSLVDATALGTDGACFALDLIGKEAGPLLTGAKDVAGKMSSVVGTVFDAVAVATDVKDLDLSKTSSQAKLGADTLTAISSVIFTAGALMEGGVPLAGQVVGTMCILGSLALGAVADNAAHDEAIALREQWLNSPGVDLGCGVAHVLANADVGAVTAWLGAGVSPTQLQDLMVHYQSVPMMSDKHVPAMMQMARECNMSPSDLLQMLHKEAPDRDALECMLDTIPEVPAGNDGYSSPRQKWLALLRPAAMAPPQPGAYPTGETPPPTDAQRAWAMESSLDDYLAKNTQEELHDSRPASPAPPASSPEPPWEQVGATGTTGGNTAQLP